MTSAISHRSPEGLGTVGALFSPSVLVQQPATTLYLAGQVAIGRDGSFVGEHDVARQARQVFDNLGIVLADASMEFADVVKFTTYIVGREHLQGFVSARAEIFAELYGAGPYPANTLLVVAGLARPQALVEIEAIAARGR